jgi:Zn-dependent metalloprotease
VEVTQNPRTDRPSFIRARIPFTALGLTRGDTTEAVAYAFASRYVDMLGLEDPRRDLELIRAATDELGMRHLILRQVYEGIEVLGGSMAIHVGAAGDTIVAMGSGVLPGIRVADTQPSLTADDATEVARQVLPGEEVQPPRLVIYPGRRRGDEPKLAWHVDVWDGSVPAHNVYIVDASDGEILDVFDRLYDGRNRETYSAEGGDILPGVLIRDETSPACGDPDVDNAHDFAGETYDYYFNTHGRDSWNGQGATMISTANYLTNWQNAAWNGTQTFYGDDFPVKDVVAHEWTHAVTQETADLVYRWQSGALNESFSDIFGAMVDRDDWLMGEDLPVGAIRDLENPPAHGQPGHVDDWLETCSDNEGVHTNSGITNKAYYEIATAIEKEHAEQIFYRALTINLLGNPNASLEDARAAALQSAEELYGSGSVEYNEVLAGFNSVGLDGVWHPAENDCLCPISLALAEPAAFPQREDAQLLSSLLHGFRDRVLSSSEAGRRVRGVYELNMTRASELLRVDPELQSQAAQILLQFQPGLSGLAEGRGQEIVFSSDMVGEVRAFLSALADADRADGDSLLALAIEREMALIEWSRLDGATFAEAVEYLEELGAQQPLR